MSWYRRVRNTRRWKTAVRVYNQTGHKTFWYQIYFPKKRKPRKKKVEETMVNPQNKLHLLMIGCSAFALLVTIALTLVHYFNLVSLIRDTWWLLINVNLAPAIFTYLLIWRTPEGVMKLWRPTILYGFLIPMIGGPFGILMSTVVLIQLG